MAHIPVMFGECMEALNIKSDGIYLDMTLGGFGHGAGICGKLSEKGIYIGLDMDEAAIERGRLASTKYKNKFILAQTHFKRFAKILADNDIQFIDGCLIDLGMSSFQLDEAERGFSFLKDAPLDMRMDRDAGVSARDIVNGYSKEELERIISEYSDERFARRISEAIARERKESGITSTMRLARIVADAIPKRFHVPGRNPATKTFQALRIETNEELAHLKQTVFSVIDVLNDKARIAVISFHSAEDRIIKQAFNEKAKGCVCPKDFPVCVCGKTPEIKILTKSPVTASKEEIESNPRSRSAKLRVAEKKGKSISIRLDA